MAIHGHTAQEILWADFLTMGTAVTQILDKSVQAICDKKFELVHEIAVAEENSDQFEVQIELECLKIIALYEPVASDLRRVVTVLKANYDWERIADLALRAARRTRKFSKQSVVTMPDEVKQMAQDVLMQVRMVQKALADRVDSPRVHDQDRNRQCVANARAVIDYNRVTHAKYHALRKQYRYNMGQSSAWFELINIIRNLSHISNKAVGIAQATIYLEEGVVVRHVRASV